MLMEAHEAYRAGSVDTALLKYAMLAELGYEVAQSNVAYILDHGKQWLNALTLLGAFVAIMKSLVQFVQCI